ncbi:unnamed protein product [Spirodela intermedia]|uniref:Multiple myeloma tumor-associated protein 2-like N-terminal domain-containing protein n=1 Tax=Spirodela intermedia TaxID=51605 RepID=A0A7I8KTF0_SPIIN|nr:unnamed protein product [Spirodela intermedia]
MYHPTRGGVRGGRDQFTWDDVKVDKHRENYLGHSIMAPVGRWQKGKDLHWYAKDKKSKADEDAIKDEIRRIKEQEEQAMREALGLAPKRAARPQGNRLDKHEYAELTKRGSTAEDLGAGHAEAAQVQGLGLYKGHEAWAQSRSLPEALSDAEDEAAAPKIPAAEAPPSPERAPEEEDRESRKRRRREERKREKRSQEPDGKRSHGRQSNKRRHRSD